MTSKSDKMLEKVRALLAKAASTPYPGEADAFRQKADQIMTAYAIDQWMVDEAQNGVNARPKPEIKMFDFSWWKTNPFGDQLWSLFQSVGSHCRVKIVSQKAVYNRGDETSYKMPVIGLASDLSWFDMLFTSLMLQMGRQVDPPPYPDLSMEENMAAQREAGMPWEPAIRRLIDGGIIEGPYSRKVYESTIRKYRAWCKRTGHPQSYVNQNTFRRNFTDGFVNEMWNRLYRMRRDTEEEYNKDHEAGSMALAVQDISVILTEMMFEEWPDLRPHPSDCTCKECREARARRRKPVRYKQDKRPIDHSAIEAGREAARKANISNAAGERIANKPKPLPR